MAILDAFCEPFVTDNDDDVDNEDGDDDSGKTLVQYYIKNKEDWLIWSFVDCNVKKSARPGGGERRSKEDSIVQRAFYSKYYRFHGIKYQVLIGPNGMALAVWAASLKSNDNGMVNTSRLDKFLQEILPRQPNGYHPVTDMVWFRMVLVWTNLPAC
jgi:hypothetical protein